MQEGIMDYQILSHYLETSQQMTCELEQREVAPPDFLQANIEPGEVRPQPQIQQYLSCSPQNSDLGDIYVHLAQSGEYQIGNYYDIVCHETDFGGSCSIGGRRAQNFYGDIQFSIDNTGAPISAHIVSEWSAIDSRVRGIYNYLRGNDSFGPVISSSW